MNHPTLWGQSTLLAGYAAAIRYKRSSVPDAIARRAVACRAQTVEPGRKTAAGAKAR